MSMLISRSLAAAGLALTLTSIALAPAHAEKRVALVVGNKDYPSLSQNDQLQKAVNDARAVGGALKKIGFDVVEGENLGRQALIDKLDAVTRMLSAGDTAFFYFSGHGVAIEGVNYILPADIPEIAAGQGTRLKGAALAEDYIAGELMHAGAQVAVVVLDACRNNPFARGGTKGVGGDKGLAPKEPPGGVFAFYAAGRGETALDRLSDSDSDPNSVFTQNSNMRREAGRRPGRIRASGSATTLRSFAATAMAQIRRRGMTSQERRIGRSLPVMMATPIHRRPDITCRTLLAFTTWRVTHGSGWRTAITTATRGRLLTDQPGQQLVAAMPAWFAAVPGAIIRGAFAPPSASGSPIRTTSAGSVWPGRFLLLDFFSSYLRGPGAEPLDL